MPRSSSLLALCALFTYSTALLVPCLQSPLPQGASIPAHATAPSPSDPHAAHGHGMDDAPAEAKVHAGHDHDHVAVTGEAAGESPAAYAVGPVCPCGCDRAPKATPSTTRVPWGIAAAVPVVSHTNEQTFGSDGPRPFPGAPFLSIDHVPIHS